MLTLKATLATVAAAAALLAAPAQAAFLKYEAVLSGANEVAPNVGDPDGSGMATILIDTFSGELSWMITVADIGNTFTGAHIHAGAAGVNGPVRVDFASQLNGGPIADPDIAGITPATAAQWYVNVHTPDHRGGAVRGQLQFIGVVPEPAMPALLLAAAGVALLGAARRKPARGA